MNKRISLILALVLVLAISSIGLAASTTKALSTNFTLVNLSTQDATGSISYVKDDGTPWTGSSHVAFGPTEADKLPANGGQLQIRQYTDTLTAGKGSVMISSNVALGSVVQILARTDPAATTGAYLGFTSGSSLWYLPLVQRRASSATGLSNTQIIVQNVGGSALTNIDINLTATSGTPATFTKTIPSLASGQSYYYDLDDETSLSAGWYGTAEIDAGAGKVAVVANTFNGANGLRTFEGFPIENVGNKWAVPQFVSKLSNGLNTPVTVLNMSGAQIEISGVDLICTGAGGNSNFTVENHTAIPAMGMYSFNPVPSPSVPAGMPTNWYGACVVDSGSADTVVFIQIRKPNVDDSNAAYNAINLNSTDTRVFVPLAAKRLTNGFATSITLQNLTANDARVKLIWKASVDCSGCLDYEENNILIPANGSILRNLRLSSGTDSGPMPNNWYGTLQVIDDPVEATPARAISGFVALTNYLPSAGDTYRAHLVLTQP